MKTFYVSIDITKDNKNISLKPTINELISDFGNSSSKEKEKKISLKSRTNPTSSNLTSSVTKEKQLLKNNLKSARKKFVLSNDENLELQYLYEFLDNNNELIDLSHIIPDLTNFIEKCNYQYKDSNFNTIINNRRKLIFYIIQEINREKILNEIFRQIRNKKKIILVDVMNKKPSNIPIQNFIDDIIENNRNFNFYFIFIYQKKFSKNNKNEMIEYDFKDNYVRIGVSCLSNNINNINIMNNIINKLKSKGQNPTNCYTDSNPKNPLDDFTILILLQCLCELDELLNPSFIRKNIYPFTRQEIKVDTDDNFNDWNLKKIMDFYKNFLPDTDNFSIYNNIFNFNFLSQDLKYKFIEKRNLLLSKN